MLSFEQAGEILDAAVDALPEGICDGLNGGVNLIRDMRRSEDGRYTMGLYHHDGMGRYVEIFYGSFAAVFGDESDEIFAEELKKTLHHELTHHVESKAGDRTLEKWDEEQTLLWQSQGAEPFPLRADSVLFVCGDGTLAAEAAALLRAALPDFSKIGAARVPDVTAALLAEYDAVLCMTLAQADALAERSPEHDRKILCLGEKDILPPLSHVKTRRQLKREIRYLAEELSAAEDGA